MQAHSTGASECLIDCGLGQRLDSEMPACRHPPLLARLRKAHCSGRHVDLDGMKLTSCSEGLSWGSTSSGRRRCCHRSVLMRSSRSLLHSSTISGRKDAR